MSSVTLSRIQSDSSTGVTPGRGSYRSDGQALSTPTDVSREDAIDVLVDTQDNKQQRPNQVPSTADECIRRVRTSTISEDKLEKEVTRLRELAPERFEENVRSLISDSSIPAAAKRLLLIELVKSAHEQVPRELRAEAAHAKLFAIINDSSLPSETQAIAVEVLTFVDSGTIGRNERLALTQAALNDSATPELKGAIILALAKSAYAQAGTIKEARQLAEHIYLSGDALLSRGRTETQIFCLLYPERSEQLAKHVATLPAADKMILAREISLQVRSLDHLGKETSSLRQIVQDIIQDPTISAKDRAEFVHSVTTSKDTVAIEGIAQALQSSKVADDIKVSIVSGVNRAEFQLNYLYKDVALLNATRESCSKLIDRAPLHSDQFNEALRGLIAFPDAKSTAILIKAFQALSNESSSGPTADATTLCFSLSRALTTCLGRCSAEEKAEYIRELQAQKISNSKFSFCRDRIVKESMPAQGRSPEVDTSENREKTLESAEDLNSHSISKQIEGLEKGLIISQDPIDNRTMLQFQMATWQKGNATPEELSKLVKVLEPYRAQHQFYVDGILALSGDIGAQVRVYQKFDDPKYGELAIGLLSRASSDYATKMLWKSLELGSLPLQIRVAEALARDDAIPFRDRLIELSKKEASLSPRLAKPFNEYIELLKKAEDLGITEPYRFSRKSLEESVKNRLEGPTLSPGQEKLAVVVIAKSDANSAFLPIREHIDQLVARGYRVMLHEVGSDKELVDAVVASTTDKNGAVVKADLLVVAGHGSQDRIALSGQDPRAEIAGAQRSSNTLDIDDTSYVQQICGRIKEQGQVLLLSCATNHKDEILIGSTNVADTFRQGLGDKAEVLTFSDPIQIRGPLKFDQQKRIQGFENDRNRPLERVEAKRANDALSLAA